MKKHKYKLKFLYMKCFVVECTQRLGIFVMSWIFQIYHFLDKLEWDVLTLLRL